MGASQAREMAELDSIGIEQSIGWHLTSNHYPPIPTMMVPVCIEAIDNANDGEWDKLVSLPEGVSWRGLTEAPTSAIVEGHHLESWIESEDY